MKRKYFFPLFFSAVFLLHHSAEAQIPNCDTLVPVFNIDFTGPNAGSTWISPMIPRNGSCCGNISTDRCILFIITTDANTIALTFGINCGGPPGATYYQVDCGPLVNVLDTAAIGAPGIHYLTCCKPGNNLCWYSITSITQQLPTGISEKENSRSSLTKDFSGNYFLNLNLLSPSSFTINIFSADGKKVDTHNYTSLQNGHHQIPIAAQNFSEGIYFCRVVGENFNKSFKFVK